MFGGGMPNMANVNNDMLKNQAAMFGKMSDVEL
jgi:hypothetical protein